MKYIKFLIFSFFLALAPTSGSFAQAPLDTTTGQHIDKTIHIPTGGEVVVQYGNPDWLASNAGQVALGGFLTLLLTFLTYLIPAWRNLNIEGSVKAIGSAIAIGSALLALKGQFTFQALTTLVPMLSGFATLLYQVFKKTGLSTTAFVDKVTKK